ncbi:MAG: hypothetical protein RQ741_02360 [Wenzhouxiangellaceae bacterium]|nr:hypothetical protein [Wenzhouxiangellaceae bacterium]
MCIYKFLYVGLDFITPDGKVSKNLPPILQRLEMSPEHYLAFIKRQHSPFANVIGALDKIQDFARHVEKSFMKGQTAAAALFSPGN